MAQLSEEQIESAEKDEGNGFELLPVAVYHGRLMGVDPTRSGPKGPYWSFQYDIVDPPEFDKRKAWDNVSLSAAAAFKRKQVWTAFGVPLATDTDEMLGTIVKLVISHRVINKGPREGEKTEQIDMVKPADPEVVARCGEVHDESTDLF